MIVIEVNDYHEMIHKMENKCKKKAEFYTLYFTSWLKSRLFRAQFMNNRMLLDYLINSKN